MTNEELQNEIDFLNKKKKKLDSSRTLCAFLFCIFVFEWESFMAGGPSVLLIVLMALITVTPAALIVFESLEIKKMKEKIKELNAQLEEISEDEEDDEDTSETEDEAEEDLEENDSGEN